MSASLAGSRPGGSGQTRRDFLFVATGAAAGAGALFSMWPFIDSMNPSSSVGALATVDLDLAPVAPGQRVTAMWRGRPVFVVHRTAGQIEQAEADDDNPTLIDPETDEGRVERAEWLVVVGVCTHLGCVPLGQNIGDPQGEYDGWFCPCHGSLYDISGRVRRGPAPRNLEVPPYSFTGSTMIRIG